MKKIVLGVSTKDAGDEKRFDQMKRDFSKYPNLELSSAPRDPLGAISATDMRDAITKAMVTGEMEELEQYLPAGISPEAVLKIISEQPTWLISEIKKLEEMSSMAGGAVEGSAGNANDEETLIREEEDLEETNMISRKEFIEELSLREKIREAIAKVNASVAVEEESVRKAIRTMIQEEVKDAPYASTGINELETLLKKIIPVIEPDYKSLTTAEEQRESFRSHILTAVQNSLSPQGGAATTSQDTIDVLDAPDQGFEMEEDQTTEDIEISVAGNDKFIDIENKPEPAEEEEDSFTVDGEEETGRNGRSGE